MIRRLLWVSRVPTSQAAFLSCLDNRMARFARATKNLVPVTGGITGFFDEYTFGVCLSTEPERVIFSRRPKPVNGTILYPFYACLNRCRENRQCQFHCFNTTRPAIGAMAQEWGNVLIKIGASLGTETGSNTFTFQNCAESARGCLVSNSSGDGDCRSYMACHSACDQGRSLYEQLFFNKQVLTVLAN